MGFHSLPSNGEKAGKNHIIYVSPFMEDGNHRSLLSIECETHPMKHRSSVTIKGHSGRGMASSNGWRIMGCYECGKGVSLPTDSHYIFGVNFIDNSTAIVYTYDLYGAGNGWRQELVTDIIYRN